MSSDLSRRGLLGLIAAAPVAALAKPAPAYASGGFVEGSVGFAMIGERPGETIVPRSGWGILEGRDFELRPGPAGQRLAILNPETVTKLAAPVDFALPNHPPEGLSPADVRSDARRSDRNQPPCGDAHLHAAASDHPILQQARAC